MSLYRPFPHSFNFWKTNKIIFKWSFFFSSFIWIY